MKITREFENKFICLLQSEIDSREVVPLDFNIIQRMKDVQHKAYTEEMKSILIQVAKDFNKEVIDFKQKEFMDCKSFYAIIDLGEDGGGLLSEMNWKLIGILVQDYPHLITWEYTASYDYYKE